METGAESQVERAEVDTVLQSGIFNRAPNLASFLRYVCNRHFEGEADQIKEYNIAVDALGRPPDFDHKKDSIVRVEAHRLRKRLKEYYATAGDGHRVRIIIPNGQYAPQFVFHELADDSRSDLNGDDAPDLATTDLATTNPATTVVLAAPKLPAIVSIVETWKQVRTGPHWTRRSVALSLLLLAAAVVCIAWMFSTRSQPKQRIATRNTEEFWHGNFADPVSSEFRLLAGYHGSPFTDRQGHRWQPDAYFSGGHSIPIKTARFIEGLPDPDLFSNFREGGFRYDIPLRSGIYEVHLYFTETNYGERNSAEGPDVSLFRVDINGQTKLDSFDVLSEAGAPNRLQVRVFKDISPAPDGKLHIQFLPQTGQPFLNALEILPSVAGRIRPVRIVARKTPVTDANGLVWSADEYAIGGHLIERKDAISTLPQKTLFEGERFGLFSYHIPVAPGKYRITLRFAETYFGSNLPGAPPANEGSRIFNVFANGIALLRNFDIVKEAGGPNRGIKRSFSNVEPNAQGLINLEFVPVRNYACINAIEVEEIE
jgi:hypothetical protein